MLRRKFFHRAKKVPVSEQELKAKMKKKDKKCNEKEDRRKKEDETAESSHAEGKETEDKSKHGLVSVCTRLPTLSRMCVCALVLGHLIGKRVRGVN